MREHLEVRVKPSGEKGLFAKRLFKKGEVVLKLEGEVTLEPTRYSIQTGESEHITDKDVGNYINHSCDPTAKVHQEEREVRAPREIHPPKDEVTIDYNDTEERMAHPFPCDCGSPNCQGFIAGRKRKI